MKEMNAAVKTKPIKVKQKKDGIVLRFRKTFFLFMLFVPALVYYIMFKYVPMWGVSLAFYEYNPFLGWEGSTFIGLQNFEILFKSPVLWPYTWNTLVISLQSLVFSFPLTIFFALLLNEIRGIRFKKVVQTVSYMPHFMSTVVIVGLITSLTDPVTGAINLVIQAFGGEGKNWLLVKEAFRPIVLISGIWQGLGWSTIVYLAAISAVDPGLYEAARLDGAGRWKQMWYITIPSIAPTVSTMFILRLGNLMDVSMEKILLLQQPITYEVSQVLSTYVYQLGIEKGNMDLSTAANLYSSVINLILLLFGNWASKKLSGSGIF